MDVVLILLVAWWLAGVLGFRRRRPKRRGKSKPWKPNPDFNDYSEFEKRNRR